MMYTSERWSCNEDNPRPPSVILSCVCNSDSLLETDIDWKSNMACKRCDVRLGMAFCVTCGGHDREHCRTLRTS